MSVFFESDPSLLELCKEVAKKQEQKSESVFTDQYCAQQCEFFNICKANHDACIKHETEGILKTLSARQREFLKLRYGYEEKARTLEDLGLQFNMTISRIYQIEAHILKTLQHPERIKRLQPFMYSALSLGKDNFYARLFTKVFKLNPDSIQNILQAGPPVSDKNPVNSCDEITIKERHMSEIIGKTLKSTIYGEGVIVNEEDGVIWVDFAEAQKQNVCFHATASFSGDTPFLTSDDANILAYIEERIQEEKNIRAKQRAIQSMRKLRIDPEYIDAFLNKDVVHCFRGDIISAVYKEYDLYKKIKWFERTNDSIVYAVLPVPDTYGGRIFTEALLYESKSTKEKESNPIKTKGKLAFTSAYYSNPNRSECGEDRQIVIQFCNKGIWALPEIFAHAAINSINKNKSSRVSMTVEELELDVRTWRYLKDAGIDTVDEILSMSQEELMRIPKLGAKRLRELMDKLESYGLSLNGPNKNTSEVLSITI